MIKLHNISTGSMRPACGGQSEPVEDLCSYNFSSSKTNFLIMKKSWLIMIVLAGIFLSACTKNPGIGGDASIKGNVFVEHWNTTFTQFISEYPGADIYVYLVFGSDISYGNRIKTNPDGEFEFKYLYKGDYTIYVYSFDSTLTDPSGLIPVEQTVNITDRKQVVDIGTLNIFQ
jgi:hypothetical protein